MRHGEDEQIMSSLRNMPKKEVNVEDKQRTLEQILSFEESWTNREKVRRTFFYTFSVLAVGLIAVMIVLASFTTSGREITAGIWDSLVVVVEKVPVETEQDLVLEPEEELIIAEDESLELDISREYVEGRTLPLTDAHYGQLWPGKTKLIWQVDLGVVHDVDPEIFIQFNDRLVEKGANFVVQFVGQDSTQVEQYQRMLRRKKEREEQVDLINTGFGASGLDRHTFPEAVQDGLLEPLDAYLAEGAGLELYEAFAPLAWSGVTMNDHIYGVDSRFIFSYPTYLFINKELIEQHQITLPEPLERVEQLEELVVQIEGLRHNGKIIRPFYFGLPDAKRLTNYVYLDSGIAVGYGDDGVPHAINPLAEQEVVSLLQFLNQYSQEGLIARLAHAGSYAQELFSGQFFAYVSTVDPATYYDGRINMTLGSFNNHVEVHSVKLQDDYTIPRPNGVNGIASWSKHKQEAFQLMTMLHTDEELSNLLRYGIEGKQFELLDGELIANRDEGRAPGRGAPHNQIITRPVGLEPENKEEFYWEMIDDLQVSPIAGFVLDERMIERELANIQAIYEQYEGLWQLRDRNVTESLQKANQELSKAGIERVLSEINEQLDIWWRTKQNFDR